MGSANDPWGDIVGQHDAIALLKQAAAANLDGAAMTNAWLFTGPPGSGRSNLAFAFAAALLSPAGGTDATVASQVSARTHPDLVVVTTEGVQISIAQARAAVERSYYAPSASRYRVVVVEDADRMTERTSNTLLKALEEPPDQTVWILCAPSEADLLPTIRSRVRTVSLAVPSTEAVAALLVERDGVDPELARIAAREAQSHIGMARRLASSEPARARRNATIETALRLETAGGAVIAAGRLLELATEDAEQFTAEQAARERDVAMQQLGIPAGGAVPPQLRRQLKAFDEAQKARAKRGLRDGVDRILVDLLSLERDVLLVQLGVREDLVNERVRSGIERVAARTRPEGTLAIIDAIMLARRRIEGNVPPLLALEAMLVVLSRGGTPADGARRKGA